MNLKLVVVSMSILGLITMNQAFAQNNDAADQTQTTQPSSAKKVKRLHHNKNEKRQVVEIEQSEPAYKGMTPVPPVCQISPNTLVLDTMTQNLGRALPNPGWFNRIAISGGIYFDAGKFGNTNAKYMGENYQRFSLNDAYLNVSATVNDWARAFLSLSYNTATIADPTDSTAGNHVAEFDAAYDDNITSGGSHRIQLEQAYITIGNFDVSPIFAQFGKQYADFGRYPIHPITESVTQVMTKTLATAAKLGFIANGFNGAIYVFDDPITKVGKSAKTTNYGAALGFEMPCPYLGWDIGVGYLHNIIGVNDIAYSVNQFNLNSTLATGGGYNTRIGGVALYGDINSGPFYLGARYVIATSRFNPLDLPKNGTADIVINPNGLGSLVADAEGAKPSAFSITAAYGFTSFCCNPQTIYIGFQTTHDAAGLNLPRNRWLAGYNIDVWTNTNFAIEWDHDTGYSRSNGGNGSTTNLVTLRAGVKFG